MTTTTGKALRIALIGGVAACSFAVCVKGLLAAYPETGSICVTNGTSSCKILGNQQCFYQGTGGCSFCMGGASLPQTVCQAVTGGLGCSPGAYTYCGAEFAGTCGSGGACSGSETGTYCNVGTGCGS